MRGINHTESEKTCSGNHLESFGIIFAEWLICLEKAALCRFGIHLKGIKPEFTRVEKGFSCSHNNYRDTIFIRYHDDSEIQLFPLKWALVYAICHETGHIVLGRVQELKYLPPVVWDEAWAHYCAVDIFMPALLPILKSEKLVQEECDLQNEIKLLMNENEPYHWGPIMILNEAVEIFRNLQGIYDGPGLLRLIKKIGNQGLNSAEYAWILKEQTRN